MESIARPHILPSLPFSLRRHNPSFSKPTLSIPPKHLSKRTILTPLKASSSAPSQTQQHSRPQNQNPLLATLKTTYVVALTATALLLSRFDSPSIAATTSPPPTTVDSTKVPAESNEEKERTLKEYLDSHPDDVKGLKGLMEVKMILRKFDEAIEIIHKLIELEPSDPEWPLFKSHIQTYNGDIELARLGFEGVLSRDPFSVEAYHGLIMVGAQSGSAELDAMTKRIESTIEKCKKERKKDVARDLKLLVAQIRVIEGKYTDALKVYQELVKEEPKDFRPYLCQGIIYTMLRKKDEADKQFQKYRRLVPKGHPYTGYFDDNMIATKLFAQKVENENMARS